MECPLRRMPNESQNVHRKSIICRRAFVSKNPEIRAAPNSTSSSSNSSENEGVTKTKTAQKTGTEPKKINVPASSVSDNNDKKPENSAHKETKKVDVQTSKGTLSMTTTIEDSKINDVVFEKTKSIPQQPTLTAASAPAAKNEIVIDEDSFQTDCNQKLSVNEKETTTTKASSSEHSSEESITNTENKPKPQRVKVDCNRSSLERNFITPSRAMTDFLLKASDLESLQKVKRRSPYEQEPPITVYWRRDVEAKALEVWGSRENLLRASLLREIERKQHQQNLFTIKRRLRDYRREVGARTVVMNEEPGLSGKSGRVVLIAVGINGINFLFKTCAWVYTGSHSMFAEAIHSLADTINQLILAYGIHKSTQIADPDHPYGYANMKYVSSLISGVGIFCVGTGLSFYHGITGLLDPVPIDNLFWAFCILGGSLVSEGATLLVAVNEIRRSAKLRGESFREYVLSGRDPCVNVVLTEDTAAVASVILAASCMGLTSITGSGVYDAIGSLIVGCMLGAVASFIIYTNVNALVGKSISEEQLNRINTELETDVMIRAIHDVKGIDMGNSLVRYKAELDFDGRELTRSYLDKQDLNELYKIVKEFKSPEELEQFLLTHGESIVDLMGGEIDRIEMKLRKKFPEIRHCDLEIL
ncbi:zinc transporter 9 isoform X2 [Teleopsis dalmanni]|nr:zinc transporter 9 isoform X2 [Teleopsis dalmanni]